MSSVASSSGTPALTGARKRRRRSASEFSAVSSGSSGSSASFSSARFSPDPDAVRVLDARLRAVLSPSSLNVITSAGPLLAATTDVVDDSGADEAHAADAAAEAALGRPLSKAEKQNAKKKRRKERERAARLDVEAKLARAGVGVRTGKPAPTTAAATAVVPYRLFADRHEVDLADKDKYELTTNPRLKPLRSDVQARIKRLAAEASSGARAGQDLRMGGRQRPVFATIRVGAASPAMLVAATVADNVKVRAVPVVSVAVRGPPSGSDTSGSAAFRQSKSGARRLRKRAAKRTGTGTAARFWAPPEGLGGKSAGYAMGWRDSVAGRREGGFEGYVRSKGR
ncbi:hypothetical protein Q5752_000283 [Cryptotrichosporon argae]